jgi:hypothetical protein
MLMAGTAMTLVQHAEINGDHPRALPTTAVEGEPEIEVPTLNVDVHRLRCDLFGSMPSSVSAPLEAQKCGYAIVFVRAICPMEHKPGNLPYGRRKCDAG